MTYNLLIIVVSAIWIIAEIVLAQKRNKTADSVSRDKSSLKLLWLVIMTAITCGVFVGVTGIGMVKATRHSAPYVGLVFIVAGSLIRIIAIRALGDYFSVKVTIHQDHRLVQSGIYSLVRHPAYAGSLISFLGLAVSFSNWITLLVIFLPILMVFLHRIKIEEAALRERFGSLYDDYSSKTARLIPKIY